MSPKRIVFASVIYPGKPSELNALLFVESIREFAGNLSQTPIWCYIPKGEEQLSSKVRDKLLALDVLLLPFNEVHSFPFLGLSPSHSFRNHTIKTRKQ
jgi:hypothetical protein